MDLENLLPVAIAVGIMLLVGFPVHEFSHALAAYRLGDGTAKLMGRLTLDPRVHFDPLGGLLLAVTWIGSAGNFGFGWAKPTPVNTAHLQGGRNGEAIVAAAGPISNLVLAIAAALPLRFILSSPTLQAQIPSMVVQVLFLFVVINLLLMVFNLFPIPPLDGSKVLFALLPPRLAWQYRPMLEQYGFILLLVVFFLPPGDSIGARVLGPVLDALLFLLVGV